MGVVLTHDIADLISIRALSAPDNIVAGGAGNGVTVNGITFDREGFANGSLPMSAKFSVLFDATIAATKTLTILADVQHSPDGATWSDFAPQIATVAATGTGAAVIGQYNFGVDLTMAYRYVRLNFTPTLSAISVDTATLMGAGVFAGFDRLPAL